MSKIEEMATLFRVHPGYSIVVLNGDGVKHFNRNLMAMAGTFPRLAVGLVLHSQTQETVGICGNEPW